MLYKMADNQLPVDGIKGNKRPKGNVILVIHRVHYGPLNLR